MGILKWLTWQFDMAVYRLFYWRWNARLAKSPELSAFFVEWSRRYSSQHGPIAMTAQVKINEIMKRYEIEWRAKEQS